MNIVPKQDLRYSDELKDAFAKVMELLRTSVLEENVIVAVQELESTGLRDDIDVYFKNSKDFYSAVACLEEMCDQVQESVNHVSFYFERVEDDDYENDDGYDSGLVFIKLKHLEIDSDAMIEMLVYNPAYEAVIDANNLYIMDGIVE